MKQLRNYIDIRKQQSTIKATNDIIGQIVDDELKRLGHDCDLNHIDVSKVTEMTALFNVDDFDDPSKYVDVNPDISKWNVSNVVNMNGMFWGCKIFNCDISEWDVSSVRDTVSMFYYCEKFNQDLSQWDVSNVKYMGWMFKYCKSFNQDLSGWNVKNVISSGSMFSGCPIKNEFKPKFKK